jgi:hypothetical protein
MIVHAHCPEAEKNLLGQIHVVRRPRGALEYPVPKLWRIA